MQVQLILILIFAIIVAAFSVQNTMAVVIRFLFWEANLSLVLVILGSIALGAVFIYLVDLAKQIQVKREMKELNQRVAALTGEKEALERALAGLQGAPEQAGYGDEAGTGQQDIPPVQYEAQAPPQHDTPAGQPTYGDELSMPLVEAQVAELQAVPQAEAQPAPKFDPETGLPLSPGEITTLEELDRMIGSADDGP
ncbi:MAG: LapA family protein [Clostridiales bacterium]|nr:LapA family protein [Clostridiales bacterium]